jgi:hypothetical protein
MRRRADIGFRAWSGIPLQLMRGKANFVQREGENGPGGSCGNGFVPHWGYRCAVRRIACYGYWFCVKTPVREGQAPVLKLRKTSVHRCLRLLGGGEAREMRASQDFMCIRTRNSRHLKGDR